MTLWPSVVVNKFPDTWCANTQLVETDDFFLSSFFFFLFFFLFNIYDHVRGIQRNLLNSLVWTNCHKELRTPKELKLKVIITFFLRGGESVHLKERQQSGVSVFMKHWQRNGAIEKVNSYSHQLLLTFL